MIYIYESHCSVVWRRLLEGKRSQKITGMLQKSKQKVKVLVAVAVEEIYQIQGWFKDKSRRTRRCMEGIVVRKRKQSE